MKQNKQFHWRNTFGYIIYKMLFFFMNNNCTTGVMYHIVFGGHHDSGFKTLIIVFRLCYISIVEHVLQRVLCNDIDMNICIFME